MIQAVGSARTLFPTTPRPNSVARTQRSNVSTLWQPSQPRQSAGSFLTLAMSWNTSIHASTDMIRDLGRHRPLTPARCSLRPSGSGWFQLAKSSPLRQPLSWLPNQRGNGAGTRLAGSIPNALPRSWLVNVSDLLPWSWCNAKREGPITREALGLLSNRKEQSAR